MRPPHPLRAVSVDSGSLPALLTATAFAFLSLACSAQTPPEDPQPPPPDHPYVLHVYADLLQIPTLVLSSQGKPSSGLSVQSFQLQLDSGPVFRPTAVHPEGNEPLNIALVLDASGAEHDLIAVLPSTPGHGLPSTLLPHDHIGVYGFDCTVVKSRTDTLAEVALAHDGVARLLAAPILHKPDAPTKTCRSKKHLWDALRVAAFDLSEQPGRRAILVLTDGEDGGSKTTMTEVRDFALNRSIAVFAMRDPANQSSSSFSGFNSVLRGPTLPSPSNEEPLALLVASTGGVILPATGKRLPDELENFIAMLRSRYILQFPRPSNDTSGYHHLDVHVAERGAEVHAAGIAVPLRDAALMNDPTTVPTDTSKMPVLGKRKPLK